MEDAIFVNKAIVYNYCIKNAIKADTIQNIKLKNGEMIMQRIIWVVNIHRQVKMLIFIIIVSPTIYTWHILCNNNTSSLSNIQQIYSLKFEITYLSLTDIGNSYFERHIYFERNLQFVSSRSFQVIFYPEVYFCATSFSHASQSCYFIVFRRVITT